MENLVDRSDAWLTALLFAVAMLVSWFVGWRLRRRSPPGPHEDPGIKFTDASMALLGLLLAFTFSLSLGRHDQRRLAAVADSNSIGDFFTCASLLNEPSRTRLQEVIRDYARHKLDMAHEPQVDRLHREEELRKCEEMQARMTDIVAVAIAGGTPIVVPLTGALNNLTSSHASYVAANRARLPGTIVALLLIGSVVPAFLMGLHQGASRQAHLSGTINFIVLVTLVIYVTLDLNQPARGLIMVNQESLERLVQSMAK